MTDQGPAAACSTPEEVRLALVLNGGISLAVWMGGVAHELDLLRRASRGDAEDGVPERDRPVFRLWKRLARSTNRRVVIDVIAGTSAGGLNGMLLATAIGRGVPLPDLRATWNRAADLGALLADDAAGSLLRGSVVEQTLAEVVAGMGEEPQLAEPVTLFLTATALDGRPQRYTDGYGGEFDVPDHRRVYRFQHDDDAVRYERDASGAWRIADRPRRDFHGRLTDPGSALLRAARATAGFPVAFAPVHEEPMADHRELPRSAPSSSVMDGGVLVNEPFRPVLDAIGERLTDARPERVLVYVVPSAGHLQQEKVGRKRPEDITWTEAASTALRYPREGNFRSATEDLADRLRTRVVEVQDRLFQQLREDPVRATQLLLQASELVEDYRHSRAAAVLWDARRHLTGTGTATSLVNPPEAEPEWLIGRCPDWLPPPVTDAEDAVHDPDPQRWRWGITPTERVLRLLMADLQGRLAAAEAGHRRHLAAAAGELCRLLAAGRAVMDAVRTSLREGPQAGPSDTGVADRVCEVFARLNVSRTLGLLVREAADTHLAALRATGDRRFATTRDTLACCLAVEVLSHAFAPASLAVEQPTPAFTFLRLGPDDLGPLFWQDRYAGMGDRKLYGIRLGHLGAFVQESWRTSDFTWGRLDAAHHLLRVLVPAVGERRTLERQLHQAVLAAETGRELMQRNLDELLDEDAVLLHRFVAGPEGHDLRQRSARSARALLLGEPAADDTSATQRILRRTNPWARAALDPRRPPTTGLPLRRRLALWLLRRATRRTRRQLDQDPLPTALRAALRGDAVRTAVTAALLCALIGAGIALAIALPLR
ncbi:DUF3376 domain-containing protein [Kitasatospora sp. NPDC051914]|uniref:DUF3376 domain-containing protein n=1 Tax=Kitasatospora sp. NPDC051914 TaxID=3154945 RepID=UPI00341FF0AC